MCHFGTHLDVSWWEIIQPSLNCCNLEPNDAVVYALSRDGLEEVASSFVYMARGWGLTVSLIKW